MSQADRLQTTPAAIHDAISEHIPYRYRAEVNLLFAQLKSNAPAILYSAITRGHEIASQLKAIGDLPSKEQLIAQIAGAINGVATKLAVSINEVPASLGRCIKAISDKEEGASDDAAA